MGELKKTPFYYSSRFWVLVYAVVLFIILLGQFVLGLIQNTKIELPFKTLNRLVNGEADLPIEVAAWLWTALVSLFCGFDRFVDIKTTMHLSSGQMSMGDLAKLRFIIVESLFIFLFALVGTLTTQKDFQLSALLTAFGSSIIIYVSGNKAVKACKYYSEVSTDNNEDGIPDVIQTEYDKWVRAQKKEGTDPAFISLDYFLDENEDFRKVLDDLKQKTR